MAKNNCLILHRKSANRPEVKEAVRAVRAKGIKLRVRIPWNKKDKPRVVREALAAGAVRVIAGGGDGTLNAVADALVGDGSKTPKAAMGILPLGTANDFAHGCKLPVEDLAACLEIACTRDPRPIDVGRMNGESFINVASGGFGAEITATTPVEMKKRLGGAAYTIMGLIKAFDLKPYEGTFEAPGESPVRGSMLFMAVGNNRLAGGGFDVAPEATLDDGLLDVAMIRHREGSAMGKLAQELKNPTDPANEIVLYRQLPAFTIEADEAFHMNLDGEPNLAHRFEFSMLTRHLEVVY